MKTRKQQVNTSIKSSFTPAPTGLLQRQCACGNHAMGGKCGECSKKERLGLQTKLKINEPGDNYEQEVGRIAAQVMATSNAPPRTQHLGDASSQLNGVPDSVHQTLASPGRPLEPALRQNMEQCFGYDFSRVRVHSGAAAEQSAREVNANAYTVEHNIVFGKGQYSPHTLAGQRLLAHELAHTLQQAKGSAAGAERISDLRDPVEQEADRAASDAIAGRPANVAMAASLHTLHRQPLPDVTRRPPARTARLMGSELLDGFALNSAVLTEEHKGRLAVLAHTLKSLLRSYPGSSVQIIGHTDASGEEKFNEWLGQRRADAISNFLLDAGVPAAAMATLSAGESKLRIKTDRPEPRNRRAEVRFEPKPRIRFFPPLELASPDVPPEQKEIPAPERLCIDYPELEVCRTGLEPSLPRCTSTNCSAVSSDRFDEQPPDLQRALAASFDDPAWWFNQELDPERRFALTSIYNRLCQLGLWCRVRRVLGVHAGEAPVSIWGVKFKVPGLTPTVDLLADDNKAILKALISSGTSCVDTGLGGTLHAGQLSLREVSTSESLHAAIGSRNLFDMHVDLYSSVTSRAGGVACQYDPTGTAAHLGREVFPEKFRRLVHLLTGWMKVGPLPIVRDIVRTGTAGVQVFPDFILTPTVPHPEPTARQEVVPSPIVGITWRGPISERPRRKSDVAPPLGREVEELLSKEIPARIRRDALVPLEAKRNLAAAELARENAGPDEERAIMAALKTARERVEAFADAHEFSKDLARRMDQARRSGRPAFSIQLGQAYAELSPASTKFILTEIRNIARIVRALLAERAKGVYKVWILFSDRVMWDIDF